MKDRSGQELKLGDKVAVTATGGYINLEITEVIGFTPKKARIGYDKTLRDSSQIAIIERNPAREAELAPKAVDANEVQDI